jgi:hypothetical protein
MNRSTNLTLFPQGVITTSIVEFAKPSASFQFLRTLPALPVTAEPTGAQAVLGQIAALKKDWNGYGALPVTAESCAHAQGFLAAVPQGMIAPEITPTSNGTITFEWESGDGDALVEIGKSRYSGHIQPRNGQTLYLQGALSAAADQRSAAEQLLAIIKELLYARYSAESITQSIQITKPSL